MSIINYLLNKQEYLYSNDLNEMFKKEKKASRENPVIRCAKYLKNDLKCLDIILEDYYNENDIVLKNVLFFNPDSKVIVIGSSIFNQKLGLCKKNLKKYINQDGVKYKIYLANDMIDTVLNEISKVMTTSFKKNFEKFKNKDIKNISSQNLRDVLISSKWGTSMSDINVRDIVGEFKMKQKHLHLMPVEEVTCDMITEDMMLSYLSKIISSKGEIDLMTKYVSSEQVFREKLAEFTNDIYVDCESVFNNEIKEYYTMSGDYIYDSMNYFNWISFKTINCIPSYFILLLRNCKIREVLVSDNDFAKVKDLITSLKSVKTIKINGENYIAELLFDNFNKTLSNSIYFQNNTWEDKLFLKNINEITHRKSVLWEK